MPPVAPATALTAAEVIVEQYSSYLLVRRGLARSTVRNYVGDARGRDRRGLVTFGTRTGEVSPITPGAGAWLSGGCVSSALNANDQPQRLID